MTNRVKKREGWKHKNLIRYLENEKSFFDEIKSIFHGCLRAIIWWKNKKLIKIADTSFKISFNEIALHLLHIWNHQIFDQNIFQSLLKLADVTPVFKKGDPTSVKNYRPVSVLPNVSNFFERIMLKQILEQMNKYLSQNLWI